MQNGSILKEELDKRGLKYKFVAKAVGIHYQTFVNHLANRVPIPEVKIRAICLSFGIPLKIFGLTDYLGLQTEG